MLTVQLHTAMHPSTDQCHRDGIGVPVEVDWIAECLRYPCKSCTKWRVLPGVLLVYLTTAQHRRH